ncbi:amidohydrolase [Sulfitobacter sp. F26169L]|uniref:amidohydrolase n=1 Tax=Sulfitobacter sp. F26169L TaxID=2996015 RepID=UPI002260ADEB|nr:amidohydrolase [Sulfitobacter sp. F26169L]MCX7567534.1 amidohydrolase [Sulfitobacter sp. F26169L]
MASDLAALTRLRHWLHAHPEISRQEVETARYMRRFLDQHAKPDSIVPLHGAGFAAVYGAAKTGKTVMLRCELDALPIHEINTDLPYRSIYDGVGHKCGHDGHMAIMAGVALRLMREPAAGRVVLLFQPDEETGTGARSCCDHPAFQALAPDFVFALHNLPGYPQGQVVCRTGTFSSEVKYAAVTFRGREAHSAQPETGASPSRAMAELTLKAYEIQAQYDSPDSYALVVPVYSRMGVQASGISPAAGEVQYTLRAANGETVQAMWSELSQAAQNLATRDGLDVSFETKEEFGATVNRDTAVTMIHRAAAQADLSYHCAKMPFRWGEDFGEFLKRYDGGMFGLGAGENQPDLHNADYDFPDEIIYGGVRVFYELIKIAQQQD